MTQLFLSGISFDDFQNSIKTIVQNEVQKIVTELSGINQEPINPEFLTRKETAQILGVSLVTLHEWTKNGVIPARRIGTRIRYQKTDILQSLKQIETLKYRRA
jgi:excisionase family DNA binding protein